MFERWKFSSIKLTVDGIRLTARHVDLGKSKGTPETLVPLGFSA